jgi:CDP-glucose 4,6-dehydratase
MNVSGLREFFSGRTVVITGHSGFTGSWLTLWLASLGAKVIGVSLPPDQGSESLFKAALVDDVCESRWLDIRDSEAVIALIGVTRPDYIFHLAAQALVRRAYRNPIETFSTNVLGTVNVLEAARRSDAVRALVCVTTDKVYENPEWCWAFREIDRLGGADPYSASKAAAELVANCYMTTLAGANSRLVLATARGGNVVGGGDWSEERLVPDIIRSVRRGETLILRHPKAIRPWQHVTELCFGYLLLAMHLERGDWRGSRGAAAAGGGAWNFGPEPGNDRSVSALTSEVLTYLGRSEFPVRVESSTLHESTYLRLDASKAKSLLGWRPLLTFEQTVAWTGSWYRDFIQDPSCARDLTMKQLHAYEELINRSFSVKMSL